MRFRVTRLQRRLRAAITTVGMVGLLAPVAQAQERPSPVAEVHGGTLLFADDGIPRENFIGGAARFYVLPRVSAGPEIAFITGNQHSHLMLTGNLTFDLLGAVNGRPRPVTPFMVAGAGLFRTREQFPGEIFTHTEGAFTAGGGVRARVGEAVTLGGEVRVGWELHLRFNALVGVRLGR
jgi:hypothetical protein